MRFHVRSFGDAIELGAIFADAFLVLTLAGLGRVGAWVGAMIEPGDLGDDDEVAA